jgi:hypothetical protein
MTGPLGLLDSNLPEQAFCWSNLGLFGLSRRIALY